MDDQESRRIRVKCEGDTGVCNVKNDTPGDGGWNCSCTHGGLVNGVVGSEWDGFDEAEMTEVCEQLLEDKCDESDNTTTSDDATDATGDAETETEATDDSEGSDDSADSSESSNSGNTGDVDSAGDSSAESTTGSNGESTDEGGEDSGCTLVRLPSQSSDWAFLLSALGL